MTVCHLQYSSVLANVFTFFIMQINDVVDLAACVCVCVCVCVRARTGFGGRISRKRKTVEGRDSVPMGHQ